MDYSELHKQALSQAERAADAQHERWKAFREGRFHQYVTEVAEDARSRFDNEEEDGAGAGQGGDHDAGSSGGSGGEPEPSA